MSQASPSGSRAERWANSRQLVDRYFDAISRGEDPSAWFSDDICLTVRGAHALAGRHIGPEAFAQVMAAMGTVMTFLGVEDVLVGDGSAMVVVRGQARSSGVDHPIRRYVMYRLHNDCIVAIDVFEDDQLIVDAALASVTLTGG
jgi:ketosteroid isomerase-like protein